MRHLFYFAFFNGGIGLGALLGGYGFTEEALGYSMGCNVVLCLYSLYRAWR